MVHISDENLVTRNLAVTNVYYQPSLICVSDIVDAPCATVDAPDGIIASVRSADPELYRVSPCRAGHHQWLGSGWGAWLPLKEAVMTLLNNEGGHTTHPYPLWQPDSHGSA